MIKKNNNSSSSRSLRYQFVDKSNLRKKRCGCLEIKIMSFGSFDWIQYSDGLCRKHLQDFLKECNRQQKIRIDAMIIKQKKAITRKKRRMLKDKEAEE